MSMSLSITSNTLARFGTRNILGVFFLSGLASLTVGCAHAPKGVLDKKAAVVERFEMEPMKLEVVRGPSGPKVEAFDAETLFTQAGLDLDAKRYAEAALGYDRILADFPESRFYEAALYNGGLSQEGLKRYDEAALRYKKLLSTRPASKDAIDAHFRLGACYAEIQRWQESLDVFKAVLLKPDLNLSDRIEAMSRKGLAEVELSQLEAAEKTFRETMAYFKDNEAKERLDTSFYLAMSQFYLGHITHRYFRALPLRLPQRQLEDDVEAKARMFLSAQAKYIEAIRVQNPVWATAAGFQIGSLYKEMYDLLLSAPVPPELDTAEKRQIYGDSLKEKLRILLEKARRIHGKNVEMAERIGVDTDWVKKSNEQLEELDQLLASLPDKAAEQATKEGAIAPRRKVDPPPPTPKPGPSKNKGGKSPDYRPRDVL